MTQIPISSFRLQGYKNDAGQDDRDVLEPIDTPDPLGPTDQEEHSVSVEMTATTVAAVATAPTETSNADIVAPIKESQVASGEIRGWSILLHFLRFFKFFFSRFRIFLDFF